MRRHSLILATIVAPLLMTVLAACGSSGSSGPGNEVASGGGIKATEGGAALSEAEQGNKYAQCMRKNGVDVPDPEAGKSPVMVDGPAGSKEHKALEACKQFLSNGGEPEKVSPADLAKIREYAKCMRANGVEMDDPDANGGLSGKASEDGAKLDAADKICQSKLPGQEG